jgi:putative peptidoglycan lipid II flippase
MSMNQSFRLGLDWWNEWYELSANRRVLASLVTVGSFTILGKLLAFLKDAVVAYQFGTGDALDAFLIALVVPHFAITLLGGSLNAALIPTYIQVREQEGQEAAQRVFSTVMLLTGGLVVILCGILMLTASSVLPRLAAGYSSEKLALARTLYLVLLASIVLSGISTTWGAVLNAANRFALAAAVPIVTSVVTILAVFSLARYWNIYTLAGAVIVGALIEAALLGWQLRRIGISLLPQWYGMTPATRQVFGQYWPMVAAAFLMGSTNVVSQSMAAMLDPGSVSALSYGNKVTAGLLGIGATAVSTAFLPHFSRMVAVADWVGIRHTLLTYTGLLLIVTIPVTLILMYMSEPVVGVLFQRGAFTEADTVLVGQVQKMYLLQVPFYLVCMLFVRFVTAMRSTHVMVWGNVINLAACVGLTYVLMQILGVAGIALATSVMYLVSCGFLAAVSFVLLGNQSRKPMEA